VREKEREKYRNIARAVHHGEICKCATRIYLLQDWFHSILFIKRFRFYLHRKRRGKRKYWIRPTTGRPGPRARTARRRKKPLPSSSPERRDHVSFPEISHLSYKRNTHTHIHICVYARIHFFFSNRCVLSKSVFVFCTRKAYCAPRRTCHT